MWSGVGLLGLVAALEVFPENWRNTQLLLWGWVPEFELVFYTHKTERLSCEPIVVELLSLSTRDVTMYVAVASSGLRPRWSRGAICLSRKTIMRAWWCFKTWRHNYACLVETFGFLAIKVHVSSVTLLPAMVFLYRQEHGSMHSLHYSRHHTACPIFSGCGRASGGGEPTRTSC